MDALREWRAYYELRPWGDPWRRSGRQVTLLAAAAGAKVAPDFEKLFLPTYTGETSEKITFQSEAEMLAEVRKVPAFAAQLEAREAAR